QQRASPNPGASVRAIMPAIVLLATLASACSSAASRIDPVASTDRGRIAEIHDRFVFADIHAHPSRFHRANIDRIDEEESARYRRGSIDLVVSNVSSDAAFHGGYTARDGSRPARLRGNDRYPLKPGDAFAFTLDRMQSVLNTIEAGDDQHAWLLASVAAAEEGSTLAPQTPSE